jgi:arylsulfatase A-like enzyme
VTPSGPNLVLVVLDTARADHVGAGHDTAFAQLGRRGRRYRHAIAPAPWTLPSHASILSGLRPSEHGVTGAAVMTPNGMRSPRPLVEALPLWLPQFLQRNGFATFCASGNPWMGRATGLTLGFEHVVEAWRTAPLPKLADPLAAGHGSAGPGRRAAVYARRALGVGDGGAAASLRHFRTFLEGRGTRPFFGFFNVMEPHAPYAPPRGHGGRRGLAALGAVRRWNADRMLRYCTERTEISDADLALLRTQYRGEISYTDAWLGRLLQLLQDTTLLDDTVVAVTADHGENLGEHHRLSHVLSMHETLLHVPLAIAGPGVEPGDEPRPVGLTALPAVLLAVLAGERHDPHSTGGPVAEYESAAAQVSGARRLDAQVPADLREELRARWIAVYDGSLKFTASSDGRERLVDLAADPHERFDVASEHPDVVSRLRAVRGRWAGDGDDLAGRLPGDVAGGPPDDLDAEITAHLEGLGYL